MTSSDRLDNNAGRKGRAWELSGPRIVKMLVDLGIFVVAVVLAFLLRFDGTIPEQGPLLIAICIQVALKAIAYMLIGLQRRSWSNLTFRDIGGIMGLAAFSAVAGTLVLVLFGPALGIPRSIALIDGLLTGLMLAAARALARYAHEQSVASVVGPDYRKRVLVIGAGESGALTVRELLRHPETGMKPVAFVDDDPSKQGQRVSTVPVLGKLADAPDVILQKKIDEQRDKQKSDDPKDNPKKDDAGSDGNKKDGDPKDDNQKKSEDGKQ